MSATNTHVLDEAIALAETAPGCYTARTHPAYANANANANAVGPFGGVSVGRPPAR